ncbi:MAG: helix-turn-helix transcriptional regulator [Bacteroidaceae bacterium]|nr:helix-turn-helix transcriptional regulator [Bacteroidaceae bacterium]
MEKVEIVLIPGIQAPTAKKGAIPTKGYAKERRMSVLYNKVKHYLDEEKVFLNPDLSLAKFSIIVGTNTSYLSGAVNSGFGCNIKTLVNRYRIEYAKELLASHKCSIHELPRLCGFSSRSAFYVAFQRVEGKSPMAYLKNVNAYKSYNNKQETKQ